MGWLILVVAVCCTALLYVVLMHTSLVLPRTLQDRVRRLERHSQRTSGTPRARCLLKLAELRRKQGLLPEAMDALQDAYKCTTDVRLMVELNYWRGLVQVELGQPAAAFSFLERAVSVPLHELNPAARQAQLQACELEVRVLVQAGDCASTECLFRRADLLRNGF